MLITASGIGADRTLYNLSQKGNGWRIITLKRMFPGNNYCPCGSQIKYKKCCQPKGIDYFLKKNGKIVREAQMTPERRAAFEAEKQRFFEEHSRKPTEEEESVMRYSEFEEIDAVIEKELIAMGASAETIYAFEKTGILITRENEHQFPPDELKRWSAAVQEYRLIQDLVKE
jgi:uncharacterized protein YchJ